MVLQVDAIKIVLDVENYVTFVGLYYQVVNEGKENKLDYVVEKVVKVHYVDYL